jgi:hypothetical protein
MPTTPKIRIAKPQATSTERAIPISSLPKCAKQPRLSSVATHSCASASKTSSNMASVPKSTPGSVAEIRSTSVIDKKNAQQTLLQSVALSFLW